MNIVTFLCHVKWWIASWESEGNKLKTTLRETDVLNGFISHMQFVLTHEQHIETLS